jgi:hypothetical protein
MAARLSALRAGRLLPPGRFLVLIFVRGWVDPMAIVRRERLGKLKKSTSSGTWTDDLPAEVAACDSRDSSAFVLMANQPIASTSFRLTSNLDEVGVTLQPTVSQPVNLGVRPPSLTQDQIFVTVTTFTGVLLGAHSDERTRLPFTIAVGPRQRRHSRFLVPLDSWPRPYFTALVSTVDSRVP